MLATHPPAGVDDTMNLAFHPGLRKRKAAPKTGKDFTENTTMKRFPALVALAAVLIWWFRS
jgi:hypothetical protein